MWYWIINTLIHLASVHSVVIALIGCTSTRLQLMKILYGLVYTSSQLKSELSQT